MSRRALCSLAAIALVVVPSACDSSSSKSAPSTTTTTTIEPVVPTTSMVPSTVPPRTTATSTTVPLPAGPVSAGPPGRRFTINSSHLTIGQPVTFSGTGCASTRTAQVYIAGVGTTGTEANTYPAPDGRWSRTVVVGDPTILGRQQVFAFCLLRSRVRAVFRYAPVDVDISTFRRVQVAPGTTVHAGTTLDVTPVGGCPEPKISQATLTLEAPTGVTGPLQTTYGTVTGRPDGSWTARVTVPAQAPAGAYQLIANCLYSRSFTAFYPAVSITVT